MKMFSKKGAVVFGAVMAVCAFVLPSMASAANWGPNNTSHVLTSNDLGFTAHLPLVGAAGSSCADSRFVGDTGTSSPVLTITSATFTNCKGTGAATGCTATPTATGLDWTATGGVSTTNIQIHRVDVDVLFETRPGGPLGSCPFENQNVRVTGTLAGGVWTAAPRTVEFLNATGLSAHTPTLGGGLVATVTGTIFDSTGTLTLS